MVESFLYLNTINPPFYYLRNRCSESECVLHDVDVVWKLLFELENVCDLIQLNAFWNQNQALDAVESVAEKKDS